MSDEPEMVDLFCGPGGAAMGYHRAGFRVTGVDIKPQPHYPFRFIQADAMTFPLAGFDAIHASPPCQHYSRITATRPGWKSRYPDLLGPTRDRLMAEATVPWVIENVPLSPIRAGLMLCGSMFGLRVQRHRLFEANFDLGFPPSCCVHPRNWFLNMYASTANRRRGTDRQYCDALGVTWATTKEAAEAIPPAYTEFIGRRLMAAIQATAA